MAHSATHVTGAIDTSNAIRIAVVAWLFASVYYFYQYALRSAPAVMMPAGTETLATTHYQTAFTPLLFGLAIAAVLTFLMRETGSAALGSSNRR